LVNRFKAVLIFYYASFGDDEKNWLGNVQLALGKGNYKN
jgi:hypothetical protein